MKLIFDLNFVVDLKGEMLGNSQGDERAKGFNINALLRIDCEKSKSKQGP